MKDINDQSKTIHYLPGQIVSSIEGFDRKYLGKTEQGFSIVQDFYCGSQKKLTDPFIIKSEDQLGWPYEISWDLCESYEGGYALYNENGLKKQNITSIMEN